MAKKPSVLAVSSLVAMSIPTMSDKVTTANMRKEIIKSNAVDVLKDTAKNDIPAIHDVNPNKKKKDFANDPDLIMVELSQDGTTPQLKEKKVHQQPRQNIVQTTAGTSISDKTVTENKVSPAQPVSQDNLATGVNSVVNNLEISKVEVLLVKAKDMNFEKNSAHVPKDSEKILQEIKDYVESNDLVMTLVGYADSFGRPSYNERLSLKRAENIGEKLVALGMSPDRIQDTLGRGEKNPLMSNDTPEGRFENRRVEFRLVKKGIEL